MVNAQHTVARMVLEHSECASVFQRHHIDYCCRGDLSIEAAAAAKGLDVQALVVELTRAMENRQGQQGSGQDDPRTMSTADLIGHIVETHHEYLREHLPFTQGLAAKVARVHGDKNPKLHDVRTAVDALTASLIPHLDDEEELLFPTILASAPDAAKVGALLQAMVDEHLGVAVLLEQLRAASDDFTLPSWACTSYRTLFAELEQLEADIFAHVHLENHVLRPRALAPVAAADADTAPSARPLQGPALTFDLVEEAKNLRATLEEHLYTARTLVIQPDFRVVMMVLRAGARIQAHKTDHRISLQGLAGHVHLNLPDRGVDLPTGGLVVLDKGIPHDVVAIEDSTVLLSIGGVHG